MTLWIAMAVLAAAATLAVLIPLRRSLTDGRSTAAQQASIYRDQLGEVDRDRDRGIIGETEAAAARTEIARRLIEADRKAGESAPAPSQRRKQGAVFAAVVGIPVVAVGLYVLLGSPDLPDMPLSARLAAPIENEDLAMLIARVESHLAENPDDGMGWEVIAPVYTRVQRYDAAVDAYARAIRFLGSTAPREGALGEAIARANQGAVTAEARAAFERARAIDPGAVQPRFYLAVGLAQDGKRDEAMVALKALIADAPPDAPWVPAVQGVLARLAAEPAVETASGAPGPDAGDVEAAAGLSPEERSAMIEGMVGQLAARLASEPGDAAGWARLIRSYMVLGRPDDAKAALAKARSALAGDSGKLALIEAEARSAGVATE